jgi:hypothetical protein
LEDILNPWEDKTCSPPSPPRTSPGETFRVLKNKEEKKHGEYCTRRLVLEAWERWRVEIHHREAGRPTMTRSLYTLEVHLTGGPVTEEFVQANPSVVRTIEIRGDQTLEDLHEAIFEAFDRWDQHMYEFQFGSGPYDPEGDRYSVGPPVEMLRHLADDRRPASDAKKTTIASLGLEVGRHFGYWFDFGDDWHHEIEVLATGDAEADVNYPRVTARIGESPPQYPSAEE